MPRVLACFGVLVGGSLFVNCSMLADTDGLSGERPTSSRSSSEGDPSGNATPSSSSTDSPGDATTDIPVPSTSATTTVDTTPPTDGGVDARPPPPVCRSNMLSCPGKPTCETSALDKRTCGACDRSCDACASGACHQCLVLQEPASGVLACPTGTVIREIVFASFGSPLGTCGDFAQASCHSPTSQSRVSTLCLGKRSCQIYASLNEFGEPCVNVVKKLAVEVRCAP